jgi:peroxiredoxin
LKEKVLGSIGLALVLTLGACGKQGVEKTGEATAAGKEAPSAAPKRLFENRDVLSLRPFRGRVVVVELACVGCPKSHEVYKTLLDLHASYAGKAEFIRVDYRQKVEDNRTYYEKNPPAFHVLGDPSGKIGLSLSSQAMPTLVLYGKWGQGRYTGLFKPETFKSMMASLLAETKPDSKNFFKKKRGPAKGDELIDFTLRDISDLEVSLQAFRKDTELFLLVFGGTSCPTSRTAVRKLGRLAAELEEENVAALLVNVGGEPAEVRDVYESMNLPFPILLDAKESVADTYGIEAVPTVFVVNAEGKVALRSLWNQKAVEQEVDILLGRKGEGDREPIEQAGEG